LPTSGLHTTKKYFAAKDEHHLAQLQCHVLVIKIVLRYVLVVKKILNVIYLFIYLCVFAKIEKYNTL